MVFIARTRWRAFLVSVLAVPHTRPYNRHRPANPLVSPTKPRRNSRKVHMPKEEFLQGTPKQVLLYHTVECTFKEWLSAYLACSYCAEPEESLELARHLIEAHQQGWVVGDAHAKLVARHTLNVVSVQPVFCSEVAA